MNRHALAAMAALVVLFGLPFRAWKTGALLPVQTVQVQRQEDGIHILTEAGEARGRDVHAAVQALCAAAPGQVFVETAQYLVLCGGVSGAEIAASGLLRPNVQVYRAQHLRDPELLRPWLAAHESDVTLAELWRKEERSAS